MPLCGKPGTHLKLSPSSCKSSSPLIIPLDSRWRKVDHAPLSFIVRTPRHHHWISPSQTLIWSSDHLLSTRLHDDASCCIAGIIGLLYSSRPLTLLCSITGVAIVGSGAYLFRLSQGSEVVWNRKGDWAPWDKVRLPPATPTCTIQTCLLTPSPIALGPIRPGRESLLIDTLTFGRTDLTLNCRRPNSSATTLNSGRSARRITSNNRPLSTLQTANAWSTSGSSARYTHFTIISFHTVRQSHFDCSFVLFRMYLDGARGCHVELSSIVR